MTFLLLLYGSAGAPSALQVATDLSFSLSLFCTRSSRARDWRPPSAVFEDVSSSTSL